MKKKVDLGLDDDDEEIENNEIISQLKRSSHKQELLDSLINYSKWGDIIVSKYFTPNI